MKDMLKLIASIVLCQLVGIIGARSTIASIPTWYALLNKPSFSPPNWIFGPVWTILYFLMGVSFYLIWKLGWNKPKVRLAGNIFLFQLLLNSLWSFLFFGFRSPILGLIDILALDVVLLYTMKKFYPLSHLAFYLLIPYLLWVSFASALNLAIVFLN